MLIATHQSHPGSAYIMENHKLFFVMATANAIWIHSVEPNTTPYATEPANEKAYAKIAALFRLITDTEAKPITRVNQLSADHQVPQWLHALRILNLEPTHPDNTEHIIHTQYPKYIANIHPDYQDIHTITPIDPIPNPRQAIKNAEAFMATLA